MSSSLAAALWPGWLASLLAVGSVEPPVAAPPEILLFDSARSNAQFSVKVLWMLDVSGQFGGVHGHVQVDRAREEAVVDARIDANAVSMRRSGTEAWAKSNEFFNVARYPEIRFLSSPFPMSRLATGGELPGTLSLRGFKGNVAFKVHASRCDKPAIDCAVEVSGSIRRGTFGMRSRKGTVSDKVELDINIWIDKSVTGPGAQ